ncbi:hypothetical protein [Haloferula sp.]|uniref:hypothetical protein n=1 Tax=Haloferula sp. TaxID=2497595 RepID=UPI003C74F78C
MTEAITRVLKDVRGIPATLSYATRISGSRDVSGREFRIDLYENIFSRYLYTFLKFLSLEGCRIVMRARPATISSIERSQYGDLLIKEGLLELGYLNGRGWDLGDRTGEKRLQPFDFNKPDDNGSVYDVPMAQHPVMYHSGCWISPAPTDQPVRISILFVGNPDPAVYSKLGSDGNFDILDRVVLWNLLSAREDAVMVDGLDGLREVPNGKVALVDSRIAKIGFKQFREVLAGYRFFLCAPGVFMPLCHNLIEALSVGSIPVIQESYAELLSPPLVDGENAITFKNQMELGEAIDRCLNMGESDLAQLSRNALSYYEENLTPVAVTRKIMDPNVRIVRLLAGERSVKLFSRKGPSK